MICGKMFTVRVGGLCDVEFVGCRTIKRFHNIFSYVFITKNTCRFYRIAGKRGRGLINIAGACMRSIPESRGGDGLVFRDNSILL